jgi:hypothetical protein
MIPLLAVLVISLAQAPAAASPVPPDVQRQVETFLASIDTPIPAERWKALGDDGVRALEPIARSGQALPTRRARAVAAAGLIGGERAHALAVSLAQDAAAPAVVRQSAVLTLGARDAAVLKRVLSVDSDLQVRGAAAQVLARSAPDGCAAVRAQQAREAPAWRPAFQRALKGCEKSPTK